MDPIADLPVGTADDLTIRLLDSALTVNRAIELLRRRHVQALANGDAQIATDLKLALDHMAAARRELVNCADAVTEASAA
jgi:hypothetical protein